MSLAASAMLAPHFSASELGADKPGIPAAALSNLYRVAAWLESARGILGVPLRITSGYRSTAENATIPGASSTTDHDDGLAADFKASGMGWLTVYNKLKASGVPAFDQIIVYPIDGHIHVGLGPKMRREYRIRLAEGGYPFITPDLLAKLKGTSAILILIVVVLVIYALAQKGTTA